MDSPTLYHWQICLHCEDTSHPDNGYVLFEGMDSFTSKLECKFDAERVVLGLLLTFHVTVPVDVVINRYKSLEHVLYTYPCGEISFKKIRQEFDRRIFAASSRNHEPNDGKMEVKTRKNGSGKIIPELSDAVMTKNHERMHILLADHGKQYSNQWVHSHRLWLTLPTMSILLDDPEGLFLLLEQNVDMFAFNGCVIWPSFSPHEIEVHRPAWPQDLNYADEMNKMCADSKFKEAFNLAPGVTAAPMLLYVWFYNRDRWGRCLEKCLDVMLARGDCHVDKFHHIVNRLRTLSA